MENFSNFEASSPLTGESLPVAKNLGNGVYSVSTSKQGAIEGVVISTGVHTLFEKVVTAIGNFCICSIAIGLVIEIIVIYGIHHKGNHVGIDKLLVLLIGGIPISMPTVLFVAS
ncbi:hypothetical protein SO802_014378 [Lithocarpus litseifolius]|uniref:P-type ATPase A domain-containing protein n=1 Tax=Lithocarpus litseifolius TaxID=425828 RepID=A0AAW2CR95_9ROSI